MDILAVKRGDNIVSLTLDCLQTLEWHLTSSMSFCFCVGVRGLCRHPLGGILFGPETPE